jgi:hypothetical protein
MDISRLKTGDDVLMFCVRAKVRSLAEIGRKCRISHESVRQHFLSRGINFLETKKYLRRIDFTDYSPWWKNQYIFEEGEEARQYSERYWITNYGTVLTKRYKNFEGVRYEKFLQLTPFFNAGFYQLTLSLPTGKKNEYTHKMVAHVWLTKPEYASHVKHKNGNTLDNHFWNLEWVAQIPKKPKVARIESPHKPKPARRPAHVTKGGKTFYLRDSSDSSDTTWLSQSEV